MGGKPGPIPPDLSGGVLGGLGDPRRLVRTPSEFNELDAARNRAQQLALSSPSHEQALSLQRAVMAQSSPVYSIRDRELREEFLSLQRELAARQRLSDQRANQFFTGVTSMPIVRPLDADLTPVDGGYDPDMPGTTIESLVTPDEGTIGPWKVWHGPSYVVSVRRDCESVFRRVANYIRVWRKHRNGLDRGV